MGTPVTVKAVAGADVRTFVVPTMIAHKDLMSALQKKFPDVSAFTVRYSAPDGTLKPVSRGTISPPPSPPRGAWHKGKPRRTSTGGLHPVRLIISELTRLDAPACDGTRVPRQGAEGSTSGQQLAPNEVVEIGEWILDFAALFREHLGIDAEAHLDLHAEVRTSRVRAPHLSTSFLPFFIPVSRLGFVFVACRGGAPGAMAETVNLLLSRIHR